MKRFLLPTLALLGLLFYTNAQTFPKGYPFIKNYDPEVPKMGLNYYAAVQDTLGLMYFANTTGLVVFDGTEWYGQVTENTEAIRSLGVDENGVVYFGGVDDFGTISKDSTGNISMISHPLEETERVNGIVHDLEILDQYVYFLSNEAIHILSKETQQVQVFPGKYFSIHKLDQRLFALKEDGIVYFDKGELNDIPETVELFSDNNKVRLLEHEEGVLIVTQDGRTHLLTENGADQWTLKRFDLQFESSFMSDVLRFDQVGEHIVGLTNDKGIYFFSQQGKLVLHLDKSTGIRSDLVYNYFQDQSGNLWLLQANGISHVEWSTAFSLYDERNGLPEFILNSIIWKDRIYAGTYSGLYVSEPSSEANISFKGYDQRSNYWFPLKSEDELFWGTNRGVSVFDEFQEKRDIIREKDAFWALEFSEDSTKILVGTNIGYFHLLQKKNGQWQRVRKFENFKQRTDFIINIEDDAFWMTDSGTGVFKLTINPTGDSILHKKFGKADGLPSDYNNRAFRFNAGAIFATEKGLYHFDSSDKKFKKDTVLSGLLENGYVFRFEQDENKNLWYTYFTNKGESHYGVLIYENGKYSKKELPGWKIGRFNFEHIRPSPSQPTFISTGYGILATQLSDLDKEPKSYKSLITSVRLIDSDSLVKGLFHKDGSKEVLNPENNSLRFTFSSTFFENHESTFYRWRLLGVDDDWSDWKQESRKDYTNLSGGDYVFEVQAINVYNHISSTASYPFRIKKPWYLLWWAFLIYFLVFFWFIYLLLRLNSVRLRNENIKLEKIIQERIKEIEEQKRQAEKDRNLIEEQSLELKRSLEERESLLKEIHHRVKNNLQVVASLLHLQSGKFEDENIKKVLEEGQGRVRSMALIHQKLYENEDIRHIPFGEYLNELISEIKSSFGSEAANVSVNIETSNIKFDIDAAIPLGLILNELVTNAFKYAYDGIKEPQLSIHLTKNGDEYLLNVRDNGVGIPEEIDIKRSRSLGLRLVKALSEQLFGEYEFNTSRGTNFELKFAA